MHLLAFKLQKKHFGTKFDFNLGYSPLNISKCPKKIAHYMYGNGLVMVWGDLGCFGVVWGVSMDRTTGMLRDQLANEFVSRYR